jgi:hypothetical protein
MSFIESLIASYLLIMGFIYTYKLITNAIWHYILTHK